MLRSRNREETTSVKHVFFKNYNQSSSFELILLLEIIKSLKFIWLGTVGMQFENAAVISTVKTESHDKKTNLRLLFFTLLKYFKCSLGSGYSFSPTCRMCVWMAKCLLGNWASRAEPEGRPAAGHSAVEEECCIYLVGKLVFWSKLDGISISTSLPGNSWAPSKQILFCGCKKLLFAISLLCLLGFEYSSHSIWGSHDWLCLRESL